MKKDNNSKNPMNDLLEISREQKGEETVSSVKENIPANQNVPSVNTKAPVHKKKNSFFKNVKLFFTCVLEELSDAVKHIDRTTVGFKMAVFAVLFCILSTGLVVGLSVVISGGEEPETFSDCLIGSKKHIVTEDQKLSYVAEKDEENKRILADDRFSVTFDFYSKDDVTCVTDKRTVGELLSLLGVELHETDVLNAESDSVIKDDTVITIDEISYGKDYVHTSIEYKTEYRDVLTIPKGTQRVQRRGVLGKDTKEYSVTYVNGVETERSLVGEYVSSYPVSAVVERGVGGSVEGINYSYALTCNTTIYYSGGITASGLPADENVVAVDPKVIPLGTKLYIPGFGIRIAADVGGAVKGYTVDICVDRDHPWANTYGRRTATVYIIED